MKGYSVLYLLEVLSHRGTWAGHPSVSFPSCMVGKRMPVGKLGQEEKGQVGICHGQIGVEF